MRRSLAACAVALVLLSCAPSAADDSGPATPVTDEAPAVTATTATTPPAPPATAAPATSPPTSAPATSPTTGPSTPPDVLVFTKTAGFRHESIATGVAALTDIGSGAGFSVTATEDASMFDDSTLAEFEVIVFLSTTGDVLDDEQQQAMERFIAAGKGFVGIHAAADTEYDWPWYGGLVGAWFQAHPAPQPARVDIVATPHPITIGVPSTFTLVDEWYDFRALPDPAITIIATVDETTYTGATMGAVHPIAWAHDYDGGRAAYLGFGHEPASYADAQVRMLIGQAVLWAATGGS